MPTKANAPSPMSAASSTPTSMTRMSDSSASPMASASPPLLPSPERGQISRIAEQRELANIYWSPNDREQQKYLFNLEKLYPEFMAQHFGLILKFLKKNHDKVIRQNLFKINFRAAYESLHAYRNQLMMMENKIAYLHEHLWLVDDSTLYSYQKSIHEDAVMAMREAVNLKKSHLSPQTFLKLFNEDLIHLLQLNHLLKNERGERCLYEKFINIKKIDPTDLFDLLCMYFPKDNKTASLAAKRLLDYDFKPADPSLSKKSR